MTTQTYHTRMSFHPNFPSSFLLSSLGHPFRVTHPVPIRLLELSSKHMYTWLEISHNLFQFYKPKPTKLVVIQEIACRLEQRNTGFQLRQFKTWRWCRGANPNSTTKVTCKKSDSKNGMSLCRVRLQVLPEWRPLHARQSEWRPNSSNTCGQGHYMAYKSTFYFKCFSLMISCDNQDLAKSGNLKKKIQCLPNLDPFSHEKSLI